MIDGSQQFKKWQWIKARIDRAPRDHRPESHKLFVDTVQIVGDPLPATGGWQIWPEIAEFFLTGVRGASTSLSDEDS